jgi:outer membrane protein OmpA-like peptidoglycan-associated protein
MQKYCSLLVVLLACHIAGVAQTNEASPPDLKASRACAQNIDAWLRVPDIKRSPGLMEDLADCYATTEDYGAAAKWYAEALAQGNDHPDCRRKYALALRAVGRYDEAIVRMREYADMTGETAATRAFQDNCSALMASRFEEGRFEVERLDRLSSQQSEIVACRHGRDIYFYSRSPRRRLGKAQQKGSPTHPFSLYAVPQSALADRSDVRVVSRNATEAEPGLGLVWDQSCSDYYVVKRERTPTGQNPPAIYRSWLDRNGAVHEEKLALNSSVAVSNFHPAVSPNGRFLVFVSNREDSYGGTDLYYCYREKDTWSEPENLGPLINTVQDESYPSFSADGKLYFSTEGFHGFGGRDIYYSELKGGEWTAAMTVGSGINSKFDDFGMVWNPASEGSTGYFTSNRTDGLRDEMFSFERYPEVVGWVQDAATGRRLPAAEVTLMAAGAEKLQLPVGSRGDYSAYIDADRTYYLEASAAGYETKTWEFDAHDIPQGGDLHFDLNLDPARSFTLQGTITDELSGAGLGQVSLRIVNGQTGEILRYDGSIGTTYEITLDAGADYALLFRKEGYNSVAVQLPLGNFQGRKVERRDLKMAVGSKILLMGTVTDAAGQRLGGLSRIDVVNMKTKAIMKTVESGQDGSFSLWIDRDMVGKYTLYASHLGVKTTHVNVIATDDQYFPISLVPARFSLEFASSELHFDYGKREVEEFSRQILDDIYFFLVHNPDVQMELRTYCDARGDSLANKSLAEQRSAFIIADLVLRGGIAMERLRHVDFGESRPVNECVDGVECTEEKHAENRRTEVYFFRPEQAHSK